MEIVGSILQILNKEESSYEIPPYKGFGNGKYMSHIIGLPSAVDLQTGGQLN